MSHYPDFPEDEYALRYSRAREMMRHWSLDALFITEETNYVYFTGHRSQQNPIDKIRPYLFILPLDGDPIAVVMPFEEYHLRATSWITDVRLYRELHTHNAVVEKTIRDLGYERGRIGCELGREQYLEISFNDFIDLKSRLPEASFEDASEILLSLRAVKSRAEINRCRSASALTARAMDRLIKTIRPGMTELAVAHTLRKFMVEEGAEKATFLIVASEFHLDGGKISVPTSRVLQDGDMVTIDTGAELEGYASDLCRTIAVGSAGQKQRELYGHLIELNFRSYEALKPGNLCEDVALLCQREMAKMGIKTQGGGRIGHGVGRESTEFPSLAPGEKVRIVPGMIFSCNPNFLTEVGFFNSEENLLITETGYEFLSDPIAPKELFVAK